MKKLKISILLPNFTAGGAERVNLHLAYEFSRAGYKVDFVVRQARGELLEEARESFAVTDLAVPRVRFLLPKLISYFRTSRPDYLIASMWPLTVIAPLAQKISGVPCKVIVSEHGILSAQYRDWGVLHRAALRVSTSVGYRLAHQRVGVSVGLVNDVTSLACMRPETFRVIHNPVPSVTAPTIEEIADAEKLWMVPPGGRVLTVGKLKQVKNHRLLMRSFALLKRSDARLMIVGDGKERSALLTLANELNIADRVIFTGFRANPSPFFMTADLFVFSSDLEGFGNVLVEALACGIPVVSTDCPSGPAEILENGRFGKLVPVGDEIGLALSMDQALDTPVDQNSLKMRAADFSPEIAARKYIELLE